MLSESPATCHNQTQLLRPTNSSHCSKLFPQTNLILLLPQATGIQGTSAYFLLCSCPEGNRTKDREGKDGCSSPPWQQGVQLCTTLPLWDRCCSTLSGHCFHQKKSKMTNCALSCFHEHKLLLRERQEEGYYASTRDNAVSILCWFQFLVLVSLFPHDDRSWKCTQALDPEGQRQG